MELPREARDRVRAMSLWFLAAALIIGALVILYALFIGFDRVRPAPVEGVAVTGERDLVVEYLGGAPGCGDPHQIDVAESQDAVVLSAYVVARYATRLDFACTDQAVLMYRTVRLDRPLGERDVRDGNREADVVVHDSLRELIAARR